MAEISEIGGNPIRDTTAYHKPSTGIPKTDLASAVQTSLGKADSALQSFTETDPTVPSWAKQPTKPSYNFSEIKSKPTTLSGYGITDAVSSAGTGLKKSGGTISADPSKIPVMNRDSWYTGLVPYCTGVTNSVPEWSAAFVSNDAVAYSIAQRDGNGNVAGAQKPIYRHTGALYVGGSIFYFSILCSKSTALNVNDFYERSDFVYTLRDVPDGGHTLTYMYYDTEDDYYYAYFLLDSYYYASTAYVAWDSVSQL